MLAPSGPAPSRQGGHLTQPRFTAPAQRLSRASATKVSSDRMSSAHEIDASDRSNEQCQLSEVLAEQRNRALRITGRSRRRSQPATTSSDAHCAHFSTGPYGLSRTVDRGDLATRSEVERSVAARRPALAGHASSLALELPDEAAKELVKHASSRVIPAVSGVRLRSPRPLEGDLRLGANQHTVDTLHVEASRAPAGAAWRPDASMSDGSAPAE